jgi:uncharacterized protein YdiU (UPF0061 family)
MQIHEATFRHSYVDELPGEATRNPRPRQVPGVLYSRADPTPVRDPRLLAWSDAMGEVLGLDRPAERGPAVDLLAGNLVTPAMKPFAARYGGHQFGSWAGQLGDGRALSIGELAGRDGRPWELQLKGAGPTPYSRHADGRAVLRSSLREFVCSEAMHALGVPTTRALALVATGDAVVRDMFYSGDPQPEPGAIVTRVAPTFVRFGHFEMPASRREVDNLRALADYVLRRHYPDLGPPSPAAYVAMFREVVRRTATLMSHWMAVGFVHGVMNTDNMSILGVTIDYGPYGWLEPYDPNWTPNTTDFATRRYAYGRQPAVGMWNLGMLAQALAPLVDDAGPLQEALDAYRGDFADDYGARLRAKLGLAATDDDDERLLDDLHPALAASQADLTRFFRKLGPVATGLATAGEGDPLTFDAFLADVCYLPGEAAEHDALRAWLGRYLGRLRREPDAPGRIRERMLRANPKYVPRNYLAQEAIEAAEHGDLSVLDRLMTALLRPYDEQPEHDDLAAKRPDWARTRPGCATLSCSS